jgi:hypothetical protein
MSDAGTIFRCEARRHPKTNNVVNTPFGNSKSGPDVSDQFHNYEIWESNGNIPNHHETVGLINCAISVKSPRLRISLFQARHPRPPPTSRTQSQSFNEICTGRLPTLLSRHTLVAVTNPGWVAIRRSQSDSKCWYRRTSLRVP